MAEDPASKTVVQLRLPDGQRASSPPRNIHRGQLGSDYSLFELETFFTRWAPDSESGAPRDGPSCSFTTGESSDCGQDDVLMVDGETQQDSTSSGLNIGQRPRFTSTAPVWPSGSQGSR